MKVGFIGVGSMGGPMCRNLIRKGQSVIVHDLDPAAVARCTELGAESAESPRAVAAQADVVFTSLPLPPDLEAVALGAEGIAAGARPGLIHVDLSTNGPGFMRRMGEALAERGITLLDAPVSGGVVRAEEGTIAVMVGGEAAAFATCRPLLECIGRHVFHLGAIGAGSVAKLVNNMIAFCNMAAAAEGLMLGAAAGMEPGRLADVIAVSSGVSRGFEFLAEKALKGDWAPMFALNLAHKDIGLAVQMADEANVPLPMAVQAQNLMRTARNLGFGGEDVTAMMRVYERLLGREVRRGE